jgi:hypothetical protein
MLRDVELTFDINERIGDETYELWLKVGAGAWGLFQTGAVAASPATTQTFQLLDLEEDVEHVAQLRMVRSGRYRSEYLAGNPDLWPSQSRVEFVPGFDPALGTPTINAAVWSRTSSVSQRVTVTATSASGSEAYTLQLLRGGVVVDEVAGPHVGAVDLVDLNPPLAAYATYTVRHVAGFLEGPQTGGVVRWAGPPAPTGLVQTFGSWYAYAFDWDAPPSGAVTEWGDDYLCPGPGNIVTRGTTAADATTTGVFSGLEKESSLEPNGNSPVTFTGYARHKVTAFTVEDVSPWEQVTIDAEMANDETAYLSCP